jgi:DNA-binding NtrC family response regulator
MLSPKTKYSLINANHKRPSKVMSPDVVHLCQRYRWRSNVRELRNIIERMAAEAEE